MRAESLTFEVKSHISISQSILQKLKSNGSPNGQGASNIIENDCIGGIIRDGQLAWIANGSNLEVFTLKNGNRVANYAFDDYQGSLKSLITCVAEVNAKNIKSCLLVIGVQRSPVGGLLYLFSVQGSRIVHRIDVIDKITSCCFISEEVCKRGSLNAFTGCVAVGTESGGIFLVDLNLNRCKQILANHQSHNSEESSCRIITAPLDKDEIHVHVKQTRCENINLGIKLNVSDIPDLAAITSILSMPQMQMIAVGLENGLMALYNLNDLSALHLAYPPEADSPLVKLTYLEPADDPRPCIYIWAFHSNQISSPFAVMHSVSFGSKNYQDRENIYETFQWSRPDLTIPINEKDSTPIACQSITKIISDEEDEQLSLCLLAWTNKISSFVLIFDLNQWYKEQMPRICDWRDYPSYLAPFPVEIDKAPLDIWLNSKSVAAFNSIQRPEEHFYPTSLSFDLIELTGTSVFNLFWTGLQNSAIQKLSETGAIAILLPDECFNEFLEASLIPQLSDQNYHANPSMQMKQEFLLSMALEYNCMSLLRECAQQWADGSHMGPNANGLTLSTLTDWIWNQAKLIKDRCNDLCVPLFDDSGIAIDLRSRKILAHYSRQLKLLAELLHMIVTNCRPYIPDEIFDELCCQRNSIRMTSEYQEVLQWLLNMGLLPEIVWNQLTLPEPANDTFTAIPYPYRILNKYYTEQRQRFYDIDRNNLNPKTKSCKCLYIDSFIDRDCNPQLLRKEWTDGDGLYPPPSLQAMLRILLSPGISLENKYMLFVYLFLDLHMVLESENFNAVQNLIKFPAVFKLNSTLIKTTQAFWNLDHNEYESALKELISPLTSDRLISSWQQELLVNTLLMKDMPNLALQVLRAPGPSVNTVLHIKTLLSNNLVTEAFELQRSKFDESLLIEFFKGCHEHKKWNYVLSLSLNEREGEILSKFLRTCDSLLSENLQLLYFLQRNKYIEALTYLDGLKHKPRSISMQRKLENTQDLIISSYQLSMNSTDRSFCDQYMAIKPRLQIDILQRGEDSSNPLSCELNPFIVDTNANVVGSVFHRAIVSAKRTGFPCSTDMKNPCKNYIPLLSNPRIDFDFNENEEVSPIFQPEPYMGISKRRPEVWNDRNIDPELRQPAAKRQRVDSFSIADQQPMKHAPGISSYLLSSLSNQANQVLKKHSDTLILDETIDTDDEQRNSYGELHETVNLLSTPVVKSSRADKSSRMGSRCQTPQSILKHRHTEAGSTLSRRSTSPSLTVNSARRSVDFNEKPLRYKIPPHKPSENDDCRLGAIPETIATNDGDDLSVNSSPSSIKGRRPIHSSHSSTSASVDEFYSPEQSKREISQHEEVRNVSEEKEEKIEDISRIPHKSETPTTGMQNIKSRRKLRSATPETSIGIMSSTRITRSAAKNIQTVDTADGPSQTLNTSTPIRTTRKRSAERSVNKSLNKEFAATDKSVQYDEKSKSFAEQSMNFGNQLEDQKNLLHDGSFITKSFTDRRVLESDDTLNEQSNKNLLPETSSFFIDSSHMNLEVVKETKLEEKEESYERPSVGEELIEEQPVQEILIVETIEESGPYTNNEREYGGHQNVEHNVSSENIVNRVIDVQIEKSQIVEIQSTSSSLTVQTVEKSINALNENSIEKEPRNLLVDASNMSESMFKKFTEYDTCTTSFYNDPSILIGRENLLEESSFHISTGTNVVSQLEKNMNSDDGDVVNVDDDESSNQNSSDSDSDSNRTISSSSDDKDEDEIKGSPAEEDEVIQISSSSDEADESKDSKSEQNDEDDIYFSTGVNEQQQYIDDNFGLNSDFTSSSQSHDFMSYGNRQDKQSDYNLTDLQSSQMQFENAPSTSQTGSITQEEAINQMIYGDLGADAEMLDLDINNAAIGFEMHSNPSFESMPQGSFVLESNMQTFDRPVDDAKDRDQFKIQESEGTAVPIEPKLTEKVELEDVDMEQPITAQQMSEHEEKEVTHVEDTINNLEKPLQACDVDIILSTTTRPEVLTDQPDEEMSSKNIEKIENDLIPSSSSVKILTRSRSRNNSTSDDTQRSTTPARRTRRTASRDVINVDEQTTNVELENIDPGHANTPARRTRRTASRDVINIDEQTTNVELQNVDPGHANTSARRTRRTASQDVANEDQKMKSAEPVTNKQEHLKAPAKRTRRTASQDVGNEVEQTPNVEAPPQSLDVEQDVKSKERKRRGVSHQKETVELKIESKTTSSSHISEPDSSDLQQNVDETIEPGEKAKSQKRKKTKSESSQFEELGERFNSEESVHTRRLRKATSHQTLTDINEGDEVDTSTVKIKKSKNDVFGGIKPRRAASHQSLSSASETNSTDGNQGQRSSRSKSVTQTELKSRARKVAPEQSLEGLEPSASNSTQRKRTVSESSNIDSELGDRFNAEESVPSRKLRRAVSHQTLSSIDEVSDDTPTKPKRSRSKKESNSTASKPRRAASHQSLSSLSEKEIDSPMKRSRKNKVSTNQEENEPKTPSKRTRHTSSELKESPSEPIERKITRSSRVKREDETNSETSSIISTRSRRTPAVDADDETASMKSVKTKRSTRAGSVLPAIVEDEDQPGTSTTDYLENSRLTRSQRSAIEKYSKMKASEPTIQRKIRKPKAEKEEFGDTELVESDTESVKSQMSKMSKASKKSKASEASSSQRTTRSLRSQNK